MLDAKDAMELTAFAPSAALRKRKAANCIYIEDSKSQWLEDFKSQWLRSPYSLDFAQLDAGWRTIAESAKTVALKAASSEAWNATEEECERACNEEIVRAARSGKSFLLWESSYVCIGRSPRLFAMVHKLQCLGYRFVEKAFYNYPQPGWFMLLFYWGTAKPHLRSRSNGMPLD